MMKPRTSRAITEQTVSGRNKPDPLNNGSIVQRNQAQSANNQQTSAQVIRKRRSSINVYDQPSSLNSRLRQLETDMLRLDEDRSKLFDDTHSTLAQHELRLNEIHAILKSRHDNMENYVEDMKILLAAKEDFEKQLKALNEKHDRMHEKFMHRETMISREIKLLKNKFESLEKSRQFRSLLQKSNNNLGPTNDNNEDLLSGFDLNESQRMKSETNSESESMKADRKRARPTQQTRSLSSNNIKALRTISKLLAPLLSLRKSNYRPRRKSNRVSSLNPSIETPAELVIDEATTGPVTATTNGVGEARKKKRGFLRNFFK